MIPLLAAAAVLAFILWGRAPRNGRFADWRGASGLSAVLALAAGAFLVMRGDWPVGLGLCIVGAWLALAARWPRPHRRAATSPGMSLSEARAILGVGPEASQDEIKDAYARLMRRAHPDQGGTSGLAAQVNAARERLSRP